MNISVVIPSYNQQQYLPDAIESALGQKHPCEIIVIDDGSTDDSLAIARKYPVKVISQVNKGLASARNTGIMNASFPYILPLDADDILLEDCVEKMEREIQENHADVIVPSFKQFGVLNSEVTLNQVPTFEDIKTANRFPYFSAIKKEVLLEVGGYNPKFNIGYEDWALWLDIFKRGHSISILQDVLVLYRTKEKSMLTEAQEHHADLVRQLAETYF